MAFYLFILLRNGLIAQSYISRKLHFHIIHLNKLTEINVKNQNNLFGELDKILVNNLYNSGDLFFLIKV